MRVYQFRHIRWPEDPTVSHREQSGSGEAGSSVRAASSTRSGARLAGRALLASALESAPPSSRGLGRRPLTAVTRVRIPLAVLILTVVEPCGSTRGRLGASARRRSGRRGTELCSILPWTSALLPVCGSGDPGSPTGRSTRSASGRRWSSADSAVAPGTHPVATVGCSQERAFPGFGRKVRGSAAVTDMLPAKSETLTRTSRTGTPEAMALIRRLGRGAGPEGRQLEFLAVKPFLPIVEPKIGTVTGRVGDTARLWAPHQQSYGRVRSDSRRPCAVRSLAAEK